jgi:membrane-bound serine protease (ClpP class)
LRRLSAPLLAAVTLLFFGAGLMSVGNPAAAQDTAPDDNNVAIVAKVSGLLDEIMADFVVEIIEGANSEGASVVVFQVNSTDSIVSDERLNELAAAITESEVPITFWVGPSGARATNKVAQLVGLEAVETVAIAPGARLGNTGEQVLDPDEFGVVFGENAAAVRDDTVAHDEAVALGIADDPAPTVGDFLVNLDQFESEVVGEGDQARREPITQVRFTRLDIIDQAMHTVASPPVAYLLFAFGLGLLIFEFYTAGVGVAGVVGAVSFLLGCYGLVALPTNIYAIVAILFAMFAYSIDVQTGVPRVWSVIATIAFVFGTVTLYDGVGMSWIPIVTGVVGMTLSMVGGMPAMVRARFSTPTIGREWMIGESGVAVDAVDPDGVVEISESLWRARTNRATPIAAGDTVIVVSIEGLILEVEPPEGAARDYRESRNGDG